MAGIFNRISRVLGSGKVDEAPPTANPRTTLQQLSAEQGELLQRVRRSAARVAVGRKSVGEHAARVAAELDSLALTARRSVEQGRDDLATEALTRRRLLAQQLSELDAEHDRLQRQEEALVLTSTRLQAKLDAIRIKQDTVWASYSAAEVQARLAEALGNLRADLGVADLAVQQAASVAASPVTFIDQAGEQPADLAEQVAAEVAALRRNVAGQATALLSGGAYRQPADHVRPGPVQDAEIFDKGE